MWFDWQMKGVIVGIVCQKLDQHIQRCFIFSRLCERLWILFMCKTINISKIENAQVLAMWAAVFVPSITNLYDSSFQLKQDHVFSKSKNMIYYRRFEASRTRMQFSNCKRPAFAFGLYCACLSVPAPKEDMIEFNIVCGFGDYCSGIVQFWFANLLPNMTAAVNGCNLIASMDLRRLRASPLGFPTKSCPRYCIWNWNMWRHGIIVDTSEMEPSHNQIQI